AGAEVGPPASAKQHAMLAGQLDDALARGARVVARATVPDTERYLVPTVLADVPTEARVLHEETFGPVLPVVRVRDADEAVRLANATAYGLSASVWGADIGRAEGVARRLHAGTVTVNDVLVAAGMAEVPHGGVKSSGFGRSHGLSGLEECTRSRTIVSERLPWLAQPWWFRYSPGMARAIDAFVRVEHGARWSDRVGAVADALPLLRRLRARRARP
ncbi:MAG TPA: aldehyde dehydrogenase family protein, partial [Gemmatimonadaceae bacterium]|nr:aldehyde dehydrogenase family protein [Gemmatimonadaceae bacterium]